MSWYLRRLLAMSPPEILWRIYRKAQIGFDYLRMIGLWPRRVPKYAETLLNDSRSHFYPAVGDTPKAITIFDLEFPLDHPFDWHRDYFTSKIVPKKFAPLLDTSNPEKVGDIKYTWEINRHQYLSALIFTEGGAHRKSEILATLTQWVRENPYLTGVNWTSSLELAIRIISWCFILDRSRSEAQQDNSALGIILKSVERQLDTIARHLSRFSSANNHLIGEATGLYLGCIVFPWLKKADKWHRKAKAILEREIIKQVTEDGVNCEQSTRYHLFTLEFFLLAYIVGHNVGDSFSPRCLSRIRAMLSYLNSTATEGGEIPNFGDSDDGRAFRVSFDETSFQVVMELGGIIFKEPAFLRFSPKPGLTTRVLLGESGVGKFKAQKKEALSMPPLPVLYEKGGKALLGDRVAGLWAVMDFGEHGYTRLAAHGHADALSLQLVIDDCYFLIDPGTYAYYSYPQWRDYFRGTAAHNTVRIDSIDQSCIGGRFLWTHKAKSYLVSWQPSEKEDICIAEHDGYRRLADPVTHRRKVVFEKSYGRFVITDTLKCQGHHDVEVFFHLHEESEIMNCLATSVVVHFKERSITFAGQHDLFRYEILRGQEKRISGWRSRAFHRKIPINTLRYLGSIEGTTEITTILTIE